MNCKHYIPVLFYDNFEFSRRFSKPLEVHVIYHLISEIPSESLMKGLEVCV